MLTSVAQFTMKPGKVALALKRVNAVRKQAELEQPGTLFYLVHRVLDMKNRPTRTLLFYESYRDEAALEAHLNSSTWKALAKGWSQCFEGSVQNITLTTLTRLGGFVKVDVA